MYPKKYLYALYAAFKNPTVFHKNKLDKTQNNVPKVLSG